MERSLMMRYLLKSAPPSSLVGGGFRDIRRTSAIRPVTTHFGNEQVEEDEKGRRVHNVFASVANKYDLMNDAMSLGIHRLWKDYYVGGLPLQSHSKVLDVAGGTGDIAFRLQKRIGPTGSVTVVDINEKMLDVGRGRAEKEPRIDPTRLQWVCADGEKLPFEENSLMFTRYHLEFVTVHMLTELFVKHTAF
ncbi:2-hexaprenyl-6-methoxy-1,4-benzoquinone methyltransferase [Parelaphostrongylus tenuis]|uniref:2-hexaprenyl-6-methoxy-1,4-benzoquinone methyltransferase n=1 Tax=Parelaphostrongylus tenuis TaxID=148309 RepID=A0AAD5QHV3_PARTN|nr:2-hexaprenyl-6-methoxy-1,4-benzoquinone methyltransferase [Parelaphostrongylus tenuis]